MATLTTDRVLHYHQRQVKFNSLSFYVIDTKCLFQRDKLLYYLERCPLRGLVKNINISNTVAVSPLQIKKIRWGKLLQISQGKFSTPKHCKFSDEISELFYVVFHCQNDFKTQK